MCIIDIGRAMLKALMPEPHKNDKACPGKAQGDGKVFLGTGRGKESKRNEETKMHKNQQPQLPPPPGGSQPETIFQKTPLTDTSYPRQASSSPCTVYNMVRIQVLVVDVTSEVCTPHLTPAFLYMSVTSSVIVLSLLPHCPQTEFHVPSGIQVPGPQQTSYNKSSDLHECHGPPSQINVNKRNNCQLGEVSIYYCTHAEVTRQPVGVKAFLLPRGSMIQVRFSGLVAGAFTHEITSRIQCLNF